MDVFALAAWYSCTEGCHRPGVAVSVLVAICILVQLHRGLSQTRGGRVCTGRHMHLGTAAQRAVTDQGGRVCTGRHMHLGTAAQRAVTDQGWPCLYWSPYASWYSCTESCHRPGVAVSVLVAICILVQLHRGLSQTRGGRVCTGRHMHLGTAAQRVVTDQGWPCLYWSPYASWYSCTESCHRPGVAVSVLVAICILVQLHRGLSQTRGGRVCTGRHMHLGTAAQRAVTDQGWPCLYWSPYASWYSCTESCHRPGVAVLWPGVWLLLVSG